MPPPAREPRAPASASSMPPWSWPMRVVAGIAALFPLAFLGIAFMRLRFPFELEWMEGAMVMHVDRVRAGLPLYVAPSLEFTPFVYPPLFFHVAAPVSAALGGGFVPLRLLAILSTVACLVLVYGMVRRDSHTRMPAFLAACLFAATYREGGAWFDLGRADMPSLALTLGGIACVRMPGRPLMWGALGGLLFALAALTKQSALMIAGPTALGLLLGDRMRAAGFVAGLALPFAAVFAWLDDASHGWFRYYVFELPRHHPIIGQLLRGFWITDLVGPLGIALAIGAIPFFLGEPGARARWRDLGILSGLLITGYLTRIHVGSFDNVVIPAYLGTSLAFGFGLATLDRLRGGAPFAAVRRVERLVAALIVFQFALLLYKPWQQVPPMAETQAGGQIVESLRRVEGPVWIPAHPYLAVLAGKPAHAHELALVDVLRGGVTTPERVAVLDSLRSALRSQRFGAVVLDGEGWTKTESEPYYELKARMFTKEESGLFWSRTGYHTRPDFVYLPRDSAR